MGPPSCLLLSRMCWWSFGGLSGYLSVFFLYSMVCAKWASLLLMQDQQIPRDAIHTLRNQDTMLIARVSIPIGIFVWLVILGSRESFSAKHMVKELFQRQVVVFFLRFRCTVIISFCLSVSTSSRKTCPWLTFTYVILSEQMTSSWSSTICTASCMLTSRWPAKWCNAFLVMGFAPVMSSLFVLFIQNRQNACDIWKHIIQIVNIVCVSTPLWSVACNALTIKWCFLHLFQIMLCRDVFPCMRQHISTHLLFHLYPGNWDQSNIAIAWYHS